MIQRVQSLYLLGSIIICGLMFFLPLGSISGDTLVRFSVCGMFNQESGELIQFNWMLSSVLSIVLLLQLASIFLFNNRNRQAMMVQISLILLLVFIVLALLYQDITSILGTAGIAEQEIEFNWSITLMGLAWILTYLALRAIRKDEALVRSTDRMR